MVARFGFFGRWWGWGRRGGARPSLGVDLVAIAVRAPFVARAGSGAVFVLAGPRVLRLAWVAWVAGVIGATGPRPAWPAVLSVSVALREVGAVAAMTAVIGSTTGVLCVAVC